MSFSGMDTKLWHGDILQCITKYNESMMHVKTDESERLCS